MNPKIIALMASDKSGLSRFKSLKGWLFENIGTSKPATPINRALLTRACYLGKHEKIDGPVYFGAYWQWRRAGCQVRRGEQATRLWYGARFVPVFLEYQVEVIDLAGAFGEICELRLREAREIEARTPWVTACGVSANQDHQAIRWAAACEKMGRDVVPF